MIHLTKFGLVYFFVSIFFISYAPRNASCTEERIVKKIKATCMHTVQSLGGKKLAIALPPGDNLLKIDTSEVNHIFEENRNRIASPVMKKNLIADLKTLLPIAHNFIRRAPASLEELKQSPFYAVKHPTLENENDVLVAEVFIPRHLQVDQAQRTSLDLHIISPASASAVGIKQSEPPDSLNELGKMLSHRRFFGDHFSDKQTLHMVAAFAVPALTINIKIPYSLANNVSSSNLSVDGFAHELSAIANENEGSALDLGELSRFGPNGDVISTPIVDLIRSETHDYLDYWATLLHHSKQYHVVDATTVDDPFSILAYQYQPQVEQHSSNASLSVWLPK